MIVERLLGSLIGTTLGLRGKRYARAHSFLAGGPSSFLNTSTLLTAAGLAATAYTLYRAHQTSTPMSSSTVVGGPPPFVPPAPPSATLPSAVPAPPSAALARGATAPPTAALPPAPPVPSAPSADARAAPIAAGDGLAPAPVDALTRLVALSLAAARCDGELGEEEYGQLVQIAREHKAEALIARELATPRPLAELASGVVDVAERADLYVLAYGMLRADESLSPAERAWLAQWAALLRLDASTTARLEKDAANRIASSPPATCA